MTQIKPILSGIKVLVCRPEPSASELCRVLESVGAEALSFPCLSIQKKELSGESKALIYELDQFEKVIVVSQHAAERIAQEVDALWPQKPEAQIWYAIGRKTADVLHQNDFNTHEPERDLNSEALLASPDLTNVKSQKILIAKGCGGRSKLEQGLRDRGARVSTLDLYERIETPYDAHEVKAALSDFAPHICIALSSETIDAVNRLAQSQSITTSELRLVVPSKRVARHAKALGFEHCLVSEDLRPIDLIKTIASNASKLKS
jgi:uroporphyrinogen-III synthase